MFFFFWSFSYVFRLTAFHYPLWFKLSLFIILLDFAFILANVHTSLNISQTILISRKMHACKWSRETIQHHTYSCLIYVIYICSTHIVLWFCFVVLRFVFPMLTVSLDFRIWLPLRYSLTLMRHKITWQRMYCCSTFQRMLWNLHMYHIGLFLSVCKWNSRKYKKNTAYFILYHVPEIYKYRNSTNVLQNSNVPLYMCTVYVLCNIWIFL